MDLFRVITDSNINSDKSNLFLADELSKSKSFIYLTATASLKSMYLNSSILSEQLKKNENIFSFEEFVRNTFMPIYSTNDQL